MKETALAVAKFVNAVPAGSLVRELRASAGWQLTASDDTVVLRHPVKGTVIVPLANVVAMIPLGGEVKRPGLPDAPPPETPKPIELPEFFKGNFPPVETKAESVKAKKK